MPTFNFPNATTPDGALIGIASEVSVLPIMALVFVWFFVFLGGVIRQSDNSRYADMPQWAVLASMSCLLLSLVMTVREGIIVLPVFMVVIGITILSAIWFFLSRGRFE